MMVLLEWGNAGMMMSSIEVISWDDLVTVTREHLRLVSIACGKCMFGVPKAHALMMGLRRWKVKKEWHAVQEENMLNMLIICEDFGYVHHAKEIEC
jgi:hypothetical protein